MKTEKQCFEKLFKFAKLTGVIKDNIYYSTIPEGTEENINLYYYWEDFLNYPSAKKCNKILATFKN